jgi:hypothetical protein
MKNRRFSLLSFLFDILIDLALIGVGIVLLLWFKAFSGHLLIRPFLEKFGDPQTILLWISLIPMVIGGLSLVNIIYRQINRILRSQD